jgi:crooked neck
MPELLWKAYIDLEIRLGEHDRVRALYSRLLERTKHVKVWISRAVFEGSVNQIARARPIFTEADAHFKAQGNKEERVMLLEAWRDYELKYGDVKSIEAVAKKLPKKIKKKRQLKGDDGVCCCGLVSRLRQVFMRSCVCWWLVCADGAGMGGVLRLPVP